MNIKIKRFCGGGLSWGSSELSDMIGLFRQLDNLEIQEKKDHGIDMICVNDEYLGEKLQDSDGYIALDGDTVVGMVCNDMADDYRNVMYVSHLVVDEKYRRRGIGKSLMEKVLEENAKDGMYTELGVSSYNVAANQLYQSLGFTITGFTMTRKGK